MRPRPHIARPRATNEILRRTNSCRDGRIRLSRGAKRRVPQSESQDRVFSVSAVSLSRTAATSDECVRGYIIALTSRGENENLRRARLV